MLCCFRRYVTSTLRRGMLVRYFHLRSTSQSGLKSSFVDLATVGTIALVDEATGYQRIREARALATILARLIAKELQPWTKTFPYEFYQQIFRLKCWSGPDGVKRPSVIGHYTNDFVYKRLAPGVLDELRERSPRLSSGHRRNRHHQWFMPEIGHPKLKEHLAAVIALMRASPNWDSFCAAFNAHFQDMVKLCYCHLMINFKRKFQ